MGIIDALFNSVIINLVFFTRYSSVVICHADALRRKNSARLQSMLQHHARLYHTILVGRLREILEEVPILSIPKYV